MRSNRSQMARAALLWLVGAAMLALGITLCHHRAQWEQENFVTSLGVYEGGKYAGFINNYVYADEMGGIHSQAFPLWGAPADCPFEVQYLRSNPANAWIKRKGPSAPLLLLYGVNGVAVVLLFGGTLLALRESTPSHLPATRSTSRRLSQHSSAA